MECVKVPNTNAHEIKIISDFDHQREKSEILSMLKLFGIELGCADKHESPAEVVTSDSTRKQQKKASQTSYDPLEKLSADFFGILQDYSQDKAFRCDELDQFVKYISDCKLTKDTLYQSLVEYCKEEEALPPPPPPTEDFSSNIVPMEDGEVSNTNALFPAGEIEFISDFDHQREKSEILSMLKLFGIELGCADKHESPAEVVTSDSDIQHEKYKILSMLKMSGIELGENCGESLVETRPSADKHETPAEVVTSDSARVQQKRKRSPISDDPFRKEDLDVVFGTSMLQYKELPCDDMEHVRLCSALCEKQAMKKRRFLMVDDQET